MKTTNSVFKILSRKRVALAVFGVFASSGAWAAPSVNDAGGTTIVTGASTAVSQSTANAIIKWNTFNVGGGESVTFTGGNATLNRILDANPSTIAGTVTGDHALFFVNPNGIIISGTMTAPTLVLSTLDISDSNFNSGNYTFNRGSATGSITNSGTIGDGGLAGNIGVAALFAANVNNTWKVRANNVAIVAADSVKLNVTTSNVNGGGNYDKTANGYSGVSNITAATVSTSIINSNATIYASDNGTNSGNIDLYSTSGTIDNSTNGVIFSYSNTHSTGAVTVSAYGDVINTDSGAIYSQSNGSSGAVTVTSAHGSISNRYGGTIYSNNVSGGAVTVSAYGDVLNNNGGNIHLYSSNNGGNPGAVTVTSTHGSVNNSASGNIYNESNIGSSGMVTVSANTTIDLTEGGTVSSNGFTYGNSGDVYISAPALLYNTSSFIWSQGWLNGEPWLGGDHWSIGAIHVRANTINGVATSSLTLANFEHTTGDTTDHHVWYGNLDFAPLTTSTQNTQALTEQIQNIMGATNAVFVNSASNANHSASSSADAQNGRVFSDKSQSVGVSPMAGQVKFVVGEDITGGANAYAYSTAVPSVFVVAE